MIVNLRGTSGSGKSYIVRQLMELAPGGRKLFMPQHVDGRKQPLYYVNPGARLWVLGHYETPCGGCDTIPSMDRIYALARKGADHGYNVLYEGLLISAEVNRAVELAKAHPLTVLALDLPFEECLASVNARRWAKDPDKPGVNPKNTMAKWKQTRRAAERLTEAGVECRWGNRQEVLDMARLALML